MPSNKQKWDDNPAKSYIKDEKIEKKKKKEQQDALNILGVAQTILQRILPLILQIFRILSVVVVILLCFIGALLFEGIRWALATWSNLSMEEIVFHLQAPIEGTNEDLFYDFMNTALSPAILVLFTAIVILLVFRKSRKNIRVIMTMMVFLSVCVAGSSIYLGWNTLQIGEYLSSQSEESTFIQDNYVAPEDAGLVFPEQKRNLVYIFLESMESTYASESEGGAYEDNYIPELTKLAEENVQFSNTEKLGGAVPTTGATWTIAGMFAQTSGLPLLIPIGDNSMDKVDSFLPDLTTMGDVLAEQGYQQMVMFGSDATFGGRKNYFTQHGNFEIYDLFTARETGDVDPDYRAWWGFEDEKLFAFAKNKITELSQSDEPFNFTMLTADTHFEDGYPCNLCRDDYPGNQYANVIACSSRQVYEFVEWVKEQPFYENTTIVISGDHLTMDSDFCDDIDVDYERTVYNAIVNSAVEPEKSKDRIFTTMDMFPTTLAAMGVTIEGDRVGLGTNLFSGSETLAEEYSRVKLNTEFAKRSTFFSNLTKGMIKVKGSVLELNQELRSLGKNLPAGF